MVRKYNSLCRIVIVDRRYVAICTDLLRIKYVSSKGSIFIKKVY